MRKRLVRFAVAGFVAAGLLAGARLPAEAQLGVSAGSSVYSEDHDFCLMSGAAVTHYQVDYSGDVFGVSASYINSDIPWIVPPPGSGAALVVPISALVAASNQQENVYISQGELITLSAEVFPLALFDRERNTGLGRADRFLRPFVSVGAALLTDGTAADPGGSRVAPTYGLRSFIAPVLGYGARLHLPSREAPISLLLQYRGTTLFVPDVEFETPDAEVLSADGERLSWGTWSIGASFRLGG